MITCLRPWLDPTLIWFSVIIFIISQFPAIGTSSRKCLLQWVTRYLPWTSSWLASETVSSSGASKSNDQIWQTNPLAGRYAGRAGQFIGLRARVFGSFINEFMSSNEGKIFFDWSSTKNTSSTFRFTKLWFQKFFWYFQLRTVAPVLITVHERTVECLLPSVRL